MKLSLEANLLPKSHAAGGVADIIYEYEKCSDYPKHSSCYLRQRYQVAIKE